MEIPGQISAEIDSVTSPSLEDKYRDAARRADTVTRMKRKIVGFHTDERKGRRASGDGYGHVFDRTVPILASRAAALASAWRDMVATGRL
jgi:hypothetical protein